MRRRGPVMVVKFIGIFIVATLAISFVVMVLWNALIPQLFNGPVLGYWQSAGLLLLSHILFRGFGRGRHFGGWGNHHWREKLEERLASMTPEEREKYKEEWRQRCGWAPGDAEKK